MEGFTYRQLIQEAEKRKRNFIDQANKELRIFFKDDFARFNHYEQGFSVFVYGLLMSKDKNGFFHVIAILKTIHSNVEYIT